MNRTAGFPQELFKDGEDERQEVFNNIKKMWFTGPVFFVPCAPDHQSSGGGRRRKPIEWRSH